MMRLTWQGDRELLRTLEQLPVRTQRQVARKALRPGATIVSAALKQAVPKLTDQDAQALTRDSSATGKLVTRHIKKGIGRKSKTYSNSGTALVAVGARYDFRSPDVRGTAGALAQRLELGSHKRPAQPFMRRALAQVGSQAMRAMTDKAAQAVADAAREAKRG